MMRTLFLIGAFLGALLASNAFASTTVSVTSGKTLTVPDNATVSGTNTGDQTVTLTGDVTGSGTGTFAATVATDAVGNTKLANMATATIKGRSTAGTGDPEDLSVSATKTLLSLDNVENTALSTWTGSSNITILGDVTTGTISSAQIPGLAGYINGFIVGYVDSDTISVSPGDVVVNGNFATLTASTNHDMTSLASGEDFHYIYISNSSSWPAPTFTDSTTEPAYSGTLHGWYNGNDRCIGVVWSPSGSATLLPFQNNRNNRYIAKNQTDGIKKVQNDGNPNATWQTVEATAYTPVNTIAILARAYNRDSDDSSPVLICPYENEANLCTENNNDGYANAAGWLEIEIGWSRDIKWFGDDNDINEFDVWVYGYQIER